MTALAVVAGSLSDEGPPGLLSAHPVAARDGVVGVLVQAVPGLDDGGGAPLRRDRVAAHGIDLGDHGDAELGMRLGHGDAGAQAGTPAPHHQHIAGRDLHGSLASLPSYYGGMD